MNRMSGLQMFAVAILAGAWFTSVPAARVCNPAARPRWRWSAELAPLRWGWNKIRTTNKVLVCTCESVLLVGARIYGSTSAWLKFQPTWGSTLASEIPPEQRNLKAVKSEFQFLICEAHTQWQFNLRRFLWQMQIGFVFYRRWIPLGACDTLNLSQQKGLVYFRAQPNKSFLLLVALMQTAHVAKK